MAKDYSKAKKKEAVGNERAAVCDRFLYLQVSITVWCSFIVHMSLSFNLRVQDQCFAFKRRTSFISLRQ